MSEDLGPEIDAALDALGKLSPEERRAFVQRFGAAARAAGVSAADAAQAMAELARRLRPEPPPDTDCRDWTPRASPRGSGRRPLEPCDPPLDSWACEPEGPPLLVGNWRELAVRRVARYSCSPEPFHFVELFCTPGYSFDRILVPGAAMLPRK